MKFFKLKWWLLLIVFIALDVVATGAGMGVPIFNIILGFPVGWFLARRHLLLQSQIRQTLSRILKDSVITSGVTFAFMCAIWGRWIPMAFKASTDFVNTGIPMILYNPHASFIGWLTLMIVISPVLQLLVTIFASNLTVIRRLKR